MAAVGLLVAAWGLLGVPARATYGARVTADEPQYLLTAISLWEDRSLDISDELREERWRDFHEAQLPVQTEPFDDGRELSPHDPLLPVLLAVPVAIGGASGAKAFLALLGGALAALLVWTAVRRFGSPVVGASVVVAAFGLSPPLAAYATQVYPELVAALAVAAVVAAVTGPLRAAGQAAAVAGIVALPWLGVKYAPVAVALGLVLAWRLLVTDPPPAVDARGGAAPERAPDDVADGLVGRTVGALRRAVTGWRRLVVPGAVLAVAGVAFLALHQAWYGGWTVYAAGDHFVGGELDVVGTGADPAGRSRRLAGLLLDRDFGLAAWGPVFLAAVPAAAALVRRRPAGWAALALPFAAGWLNATFVALTMHGWWWPGRQVVVVVPGLVLAVAWWAPRVVRWAVGLVAGLGLAGMALWGRMLVLVVHEGWRLIIDLDRWTDPVVGAWRRTLPDNRDGGTTTWALQAAWLVVLALVGVWAWRHAPDDPPRVDPSPLDPSLVDAR
jgi:hypothetical protein